MEETGHSNNNTRRPIGTDALLVHLTHNLEIKRKEIEVDCVKLQNRINHLSFTGCCSTEFFDALRKLERLNCLYGLSNKPEDYATYIHTLQFIHNTCLKLVSEKS